ncbi:MAG: T9SS type A sorting domain-containing protein [Bacteroidia bacterium]|nr:T9SS type A sorting domain-containing protein [Bacteroidia bacterium]
MKNYLRLLILLVLILTNLKLFASSNTDCKKLITSNKLIPETPALEETAVTEAQILRLEFRVSNGASRSFVIGFAENSTDGFDYGYDGGIILNPPVDDMGSLLDGQQYVIQAFAPITPDKEIDLVLHASGLFNYTLISTEISNFPEDQDLFIKDNLTGQYFDLRSPKGYHFNSEAGTFTERFQVIFQDPSTLSNEEFFDEKAVIFINQWENKLYVNSLSSKAKKLSITNMLGQNIKIFHTTDNQTLENGVDISSFNSGVYIVSIQTEYNISIDKKVIIN